VPGGANLDAIAALSISKKRGKIKSLAATFPLFLNGAVNIQNKDVDVSCRVAFPPLAPSRCPFSSVGSLAFTWKT